MRRILWNRRGEDIDEIVIDDPTSVHIEQMSDRCWWIGIGVPGGGRWMGTFYATSRGRMTFLGESDNLPEDGPWVWDIDESHEDKR